MVCRDCNTTICHGIIRPNDEEKRKRLKVKCPCGGFSFVLEVPEKAHRLTTPDDMYFSGFEFNDDLNLKIVEVSKK